MDDLVAFVRTQLDVRMAQLVEDERVARNAIDPGSGDWNGNLGHGPSVEDVAGNVVVYDEGYPTDDQALHIARWDPARVSAEVRLGRAEVEAKRQRLGLIERMLADDPNDATAHRLLRLEALPFAGRDGYRRKWAPQHVPTNEVVDYLGEE